MEYIEKRVKEVIAQYEIQDTSLIKPSECFYRDLMYIIELAVEQEKKRFKREMASEIRSLLGEFRYL